MRLIPIYTWTKGIRNFDHRRKQFSQLPWAQGVLLLCCVVVAMLLANLPFTKEFYHNFLETDISLRFQSPGGESILFPNGMTVEKFINDILMTVFFFTVGLEIRREMKNGELSSLKKAMMPVIAAFGSTTLLINSRLEITIRTMHSSAMRQMASTASITCRFAALREVTSRMTPTTLPWNTNGWDTAIMFSPVSGSHPRKGAISAVSMAWVMSPVPGDVPAVRPEVDTWMRPLLLLCQFDEFGSNLSRHITALAENHSPH